MNDLVEIVENHFLSMNKLHSFNPRRCNSASALSGCFERNISKVILTLPTNAETVQPVKLTVGISCVNTRLGLDTEILFHNLTNKLTLNSI